MHAALQIEAFRMAEKCFGSVEIPDQVIKHIFLKPESGDKLCVGEHGGSIQRVGVSPGGSVRRHWRRRIREEGWEVVSQMSRKAFKGNRITDGLWRCKCFLLPPPFFYQSHALHSPSPSLYFPLSRAPFLGNSGPVKKVIGEVWEKFKERKSRGKIKASLHKDCNLYQEIEKGKGREIERESWKD